MNTLELEVCGKGIEHAHFEVLEQIEPVFYRGDYVPNKYGLIFNLFMQENTSATIYLEVFKKS